MTKAFTGDCRIGFGTWPLGGEATLGNVNIGHNPQDPVEALASLDRALELGVQFFDTADIYGLGRAETLLGKALRGRRDQAFLCTKFGVREDANGETIADFSGDWLRQSVEGSLRRIGTDHLDCVLMHGPADSFSWGDYDPRPFDDLVAAGKIGSYGVSVRSVKGAEEVLAARFGNAIEVIYNALDRRIEDKVLGMAEDQNVLIIARIPMAKGFLSRRFLDTDPKFATTDNRTLIPLDQREWMLEMARRLRFLDDLPGGMAVSALRFCLSDPRVGVIIPGMRTISQVEENFLAAQLGALPKEVIGSIKSLVPDVHHSWR